MSLIKDCLSSGSKISSKRVITAIATLLFVMCTVTELYTDYEVSKNTYNSIMWIVIGGVGFTASEKFSKTSDKSPTNTPS